MSFSWKYRNSFWQDNLWRDCRFTGFLSFILVWVSISRPALADDAVVSPYSAILQKHGIDQDAKGLGEYLRKLHPSEEQQREAKRLVEQLGSEKYFDRESATLQLIEMPAPPTEMLKLATKSDNIEIRVRAHRILREANPLRSELIYAALTTIERDRVPGLASDLLKTVPLCEPYHLRRAVREAMRTTAQPGDVPLLREATKNNDPQIVIAAIFGLEAALGESTQDDLRRLMEHPTEEVSLAATRALANQGDRTSLRSLLKLLDAKSLEVRVGAIGTMRQLTGKRNQYLAYEDPGPREKAIGRWATWIESNGDTAKLHFPLQTANIELGHTLITVGGLDKVIVLDANGKQIWEKEGLDHPCGCIGLPNGHRLLLSNNGRYAAEYDGGGKEIWRKTELPEGPIGVRRLGNGNTLVGCGGGKVVEIRPDGSTAWEVTLGGLPVDVRRLENGRTLVSQNTNNRVVEVDRDGKVVWELKDLDDPRTAQRLENGNTLVAESGAGRVTERDRTGKIVWQHDGLGQPHSAQRLPNGNTLISIYGEGGGVQEVDRAGKIVWEKKIDEVWHASRY